MPQPGQQPVYYRSFQFLVEIDGIANARFQEVGGIDATTDVTEYREGGDKGATHTVTGDLTIKDITKTVTFPATISVARSSSTGSLAEDAEGVEADMRRDGSGPAWGSLGGMVMTMFST